MELSITNYMYFHCYMNIVATIYIISNILFGETLQIYSSSIDKQVFYIILLIKNSCTGPVSHALGLLHYSKSKAEDL